MKMRRDIIFIFSLFYPFAGFAQQTAGDLKRSGDAKAHKGDYEAAIADFTGAIELDPKDMQAFLSRAMAKKNKGDYNGAIADYTQAITLDPKDAFTYLDRGKAEDEKGDFDVAISDFTKAVELDQQTPSLDYFFRGDLGSSSPAMKIHTVSH